MTPSPGLTLDLSELASDDHARTGGKAVALGRMARAGIPIPPGVVITTAAYQCYLDRTGLRQRLPLLLERKPFEAMRWEELWDLGLRVRNLFLTTPLPADLAADLAAELADRLGPRFADTPVTVRSSAPAEDSARASFAGLHDSFVNVRSVPAILDRLRLVWASLWSDRALLYRKELGLDPAASAMAVIVQELIDGDCSGVAFSRCPGRPQLAAIEAVWGLNQGLVDGDVEADRYLLDRRGRIVEQHAPKRERFCQIAAQGVALHPLPAEKAAMPPLSALAAEQVYELLRRAEVLFKAPQDMEWTRRGQELFALQSRPITAAGADTDGQRAWYLTLHRSLATLRDLRRSIEDQLLPAMTREARQLAGVAPATLDDAALASVIRQRRTALETWQERYRDQCIPMAHGIRLFGQIYNDRLRPADPFAFLELLAGDKDLLAVQRNRGLRELAVLLRNDPHLSARLRRGEPPPPQGSFACALTRFTATFGPLTGVLGAPGEGLKSVIDLLVELGGAPPAERHRFEAADEAQYLAVFPAEQQAFARDVLEIGRAAYRLRDNDNLFLGRFAALLREACDEAKRRLAVGKSSELAPLAATSRVTPTGGWPAAAAPDRLAGTRRQARQIVGQPAGPGLARGRARVVRREDDLRTFQSGEILVCDAVDPTMTFVAPLAAAIVERRGGMLIHGAIIAREYGIPCVTGVPDAASLIRTGDRVTVDGYMGLVTIEAATAEPG